jgi:hypothetical protein
MSAMKRAAVDYVTISSQFRVKEFIVKGQAKEKDLSRGETNSFRRILEKIKRIFHDFHK